MGKGTEGKGGGREVMGGTRGVGGYKVKRKVQWFRFMFRDQNADTRARRWTE